MTLSGHTATHFRTDILARLLRPIGALLALFVALGGAGFWWTCNSAESASLERQRNRMAGAMQEQMDHARDKLATIVGMSPDAGSFRDSLDDPPASLQFPGADFQNLVLLSPDLQILAGRTSDDHSDDPSAPVLRALLAGAVSAANDSQLRSALDAAGKASAHRPVAQVRAIGDQVFIFAAVRSGDVWPDESRPSADGTIVGFERWDQAKLAWLGRRNGLSDTMLSTDPSGNGEASIPLLDTEGHVATHLTWTKDSFGTRMKARLIPFLAIQVGLAIVLFCGVSIFVRRATRDLAEREVLSRELMARDPLSGLANRLLFNERLDRELVRIARDGGGLAVMFIDLDRFKDVNDTYGHQAGDDLIQLVAQRLAALLGRVETLARFGGDEFAIIQPGIASAEQAAILARQILEDLSQPFELAHSAVMVGASIGVALAPKNGRDRETLMRLADTALYQAKSEGRNRSCFYQNHMDEALRMRKVVEEDLRRAIATDELELHYQPLFSSDGETIVGLEALIRWPHPVRGMIAPSDFIPIAEERGLIIPLGDWVLRRACRDGMRWPDLRIAVNVSAIQFRHRDYVGSVMRTLKETGFDPSRLELELTEGVIVGDADAAEAAMVDLRALGVHLALDDFGTGYSSLIYLRRFAFDKIKIDRSFLESMEATGESAILVHSIVHLGRALGLTVTAEGVETRDQHRFLQALGCHQLQGYLFSRPVPAAEIDRMLAAASRGVATATAA